MEENNVVEVEATENQPVNNDAANKQILIGFILACVGIAISWGWIVGGIAGIVVSAIALKKIKNVDSDQNPYKVFRRIAKPVAIVALILSIISIITWAIIGILEIVAIILAAIAEGVNGGMNIILPLL